MTNLSRITALEKEVEDLTAFYKSNGMPETVRLFQEDFDFLNKQNKLMKFADEVTFNGYRVAKGPRKKKARKKRPPEFRF